MDVAGKLREKGIKVTPQRIFILKRLMEMEGHVTAEDVYNSIKKEIPSISISTVYRTLKQFEDKGIINSLLTSKEYGVTVFDTNFEPHHHFVCKICGEIWDIPGEIMKVNVKGDIGGIGESLTVTVKGTCHRCENKGKQKEKQR